MRSRQDAGQVSYVIREAPPRPPAEATPGDESELTGVNLKRSKLPHVLRDEDGKIKCRSGKSGEPVSLDFLNVNIAYGGI